MHDVRNRVFSRRRVTQGALSAAFLTAMPAAGGTVTRPEALTRYGRVRGFVRNGAAIFLGIPYGADTSGARRFRAPVAPAPWRGVRDATTPGQRAPQAAPPPAQGPIADYFTGNRTTELRVMPEPIGEDCLVVNVVTPAVDKRSRPVMVYIHGGGFTGGSGLVMTLGDAFVVREDVVLVTLNHRLGALGYMYLGGIAPAEADANVGMLDLVAALRWVRDNIANFGGDPTKVTLFGESGGGIKIGHLMAMPQARGLFRSAIIQSGLYPEPLPTDQATAATRAFMMRASAADVAALRKLPYTAFVGAGMPGSRPAADGTTLVAHRWDRAPETAARVPLLIGHCKDELTLFALVNPALFALEWSAVPAQLSKAVALPADAAGRVVDSYRAAFPDDTPSDAYFRISSDASFGRVMVEMADRKAAQRPPVYFYRMELDTKLAPGLRSMHTAELPLTVGLVPRPEAAGLARQISAAWAAFARTGDPNHAGMPHWNRHRPGDGQGMIFNIESRFGPDPQAAPRAVLYEALGDVKFYNPL